GAAPVQAAPSSSLLGATAEWLRLHRVWKKRSDRARRSVIARSASREAALVSICVSPLGEKRNLRSLLESLNASLYPRIEVLSSETGIPGVTVVPEDKLPGRPWTVRFASCARGKYVFFVEGIEALDSQAVSLLVRVAESTGRSCLTAIAAHFDRECGFRWLIPTPGDEIGAMVRPDARVPLLFCERKRFLSEASEALGRIDPRGPGPARLAVWAAILASRDEQVTCVPRALAMMRHAWPNESERQIVGEALAGWMESQLPTRYSHLPAALAALAARQRGTEQKLKAALAELEKRSSGQPARMPVERRAPPRRRVDEQASGLLS
ncbi:MAG TPA: hypothetical protein VM598_03180, partial [Bdellovibrionota bacterium]|nr:hypothetical protein [Bdellovibrionota bacterium]